MRGQPHIGPIQQRSVSDSFSGRAWRLLGHSDRPWPFWVRPGLTALNFVYGAFVAPEKPAGFGSPRVSAAAGHPFPFVAAIGTVPSVLGLANFRFFFLQLAAQMLQSTWVLFTEYRFAWTERDVGLSLAMVGLVFGLVQGGPDTDRDSKTRRAAVDLYRSRFLYRG